MSLITKFKSLLAKSATIPLISGNTSFADDVGVLGQLETSSEQALVTDYSVLNKTLHKQLLMSNDFIFIDDDFLMGTSIGSGVFTSDLEWVSLPLQGSSASRHCFGADNNIGCVGDIGLDTGAVRRDSIILYINSTSGGAGPIKPTLANIFNTTTEIKVRFYIGGSNLGMRIGFIGIPTLARANVNRFAGITSNPVSTAWTASNVVVLGEYRRPTSSNGRRYYASVAGTTHATTEPTWPVTNGGTVTDGTVTWKEDGREGHANFQFQSNDTDAPLSGTQTDSGAVVSTGWHTFKMRYIGSLQWAMSINGGTEYNLTANYTSVVFGFQCMTYEAAKKYVLIDYFKFYQEGR